MPELNEIGPENDCGNSILIFLEADWNNNYNKNLNIWISYKSEGSLDAGQTLPASPDNRKPWKTQTNKQ